MIGGEDLYKPLCRECFNDETLVKEMREAQLEEEQVTLKSTSNTKEFLTMTENKAPSLKTKTLKEESSFSSIE